MQIYGISRCAQQVIVVCCSFAATAAAAAVVVVVNIRLTASTCSPLDHLQHAAAAAARPISHLWLNALFEFCITESLPTFYWDAREGVKSIERRGGG